MKIIILILLSVVVAAAVLLLLIKRYMSRIRNLQLLYDRDDSVITTVIKDVAYKQKDGKDLMMDIYLPEKTDSRGKFPAIFFVHGEGPEKFLKDIKEWGLYTGYGRLAASFGFAGITFHRSRSNFSFKNNEVAQDILDAVAFVRQNADQWNIDRDRICIWGFSLGGMYLSLFMKDSPKYIKALVSFYGLLDLQFRTKNLQNVSSHYQIEYYLPENPGSIPPILLVKAGKDKVKGVNASQDHFLRIAMERQIPVEFLVHGTGEHTFDALNNNAETRETLEKTWDFIRRNL